MNVFDYSIKSVKDVLIEFKTSAQDGLKQHEVEKRLKKYGPNELAVRKLSGLKIFLRQFKSAFVYLLLMAVAITLLLGETLETLMIFAFLTVNAILGFYQEYRSEKTAQFLSQYIAPKTKVLRSGKVTSVLSKDLVPGDIIILKTGDKVPADVRFIEQCNLIVDEAMLTGESIAVHKNENILKEKAAAYYQAFNLGFSGTNILNGQARAIVLATGKKTSLGAIAKLATETRHLSDFEKGISRFASFIFKLVGLTLLIVFIANVLIKKGNIDFIELIIFSIALTVSVIPEALPLVTTFSLAEGAKRLADHHVIVKRLSAVEDLGGIEILCADKTGTLTENKLKVANIYSDFPEETLFTANLASAFEQEQKLEPFDIALWQELSANQQKDIIKNTKLKEAPFNPKTRRNIVLVQKNNATQIIVRGAPEEILPACFNISDQEKHNAEKWFKMESKQGHRVLAVAQKKLGDNSIKDIDLDAERQYDFLGIISFVDSLKSSAYEVVKKANQLGVKIKILTGDNAEVAGAVAYQIGLVDSPQHVITGSAWQALDKEQKIKALQEYAVFARVAPEQKYAIIDILRENNTVGFLGEGINDAPALKLAGVSIVVNTVADIAREAADIILLKKNLTVILDGIEEGRKVFANTTKYIKVTLASNFGNFFAIAAASLMIDFLPMLPAQILLVNLLSDLPMISISTDTVTQDELVTPKKYEIKDIVLFAVVLGMISTIFDFIFFGLFYRISPSVLQTNWFIGSILTELVLIYVVRTKLVFFKTAWPSKALGVLTILAAVLTVSLPFTTFGQRVFSFTKPTIFHLMLILAIVVIYFVCSEIVKLMFYKRVNNHNQAAL